MQQQPFFFFLSTASYITELKGKEEIDGKMKEEEEEEEEEEEAKEASGKGPTHKQISLTNKQGWMMIYMWACTKRLTVCMFSVVGNLFSFQAF